MTELEKAVAVIEAFDPYVDGERVIVYWPDRCGNPWVEGRIECAPDNTIRVRDVDSWPGIEDVIATRPS